MEPNDFTSSVIFSLVWESKEAEVALDVEWLEIHASLVFLLGGLQ